MASASPLSEVSIAESDALIIPAAMIKAGSGNSGLGNDRKSRRAKLVGDWAEGAAVRYIRERVAGCGDCVHRAAVDETPVRDIDYVDVHGVLQRVEVKGTIAAAFTGIDMTANEMSAAASPSNKLLAIFDCGCLTPRRKFKRYKTRNANRQRENGAQCLRSFRCDLPGLLTR